MENFKIQQKQKLGEIATLWKWNVAKKCKTKFLNHTATVGRKNLKVWGKGLWF